MQNIPLAWCRRFLVVVTLSAGLAVSAGRAQSGSEEFDERHLAVRNAIAMQQEVTRGVMNWPDVLGTAVGAGEDGQPSLVVYVHHQGPSAAAVLRAMPGQYRGVRVQVQLTDKFVAYGNTAKQTLPIKLGTSGGWSKDIANGYCCGGTLGALVKVNGTQYLLSNYHVLESDIVSGGNGIIANTGDPVVQPGLIDVACNAGNAQSVGTLVKIASLPGSNVDCAVAQANPGMVDSTGAILGIGTISSNTVGAKLRQAVKKSGRTTGLTSSKVSGLNATISVTYENECAGGTAFTKTFTGQIVISNSGNGFLNAGDSGSLLVENVSTNPRAVGLLFAGSSTSAIANPIAPVLQYIGSKLGGTATMVGK